MRTYAQSLCSLGPAGVPEGSAVWPMYIRFRGTRDALYHSLLLVCWNWVLSVHSQVVLKELMEGTVCAEIIRAQNFRSFRDPAVFHSRIFLGVA